MMLRQSIGPRCNRGDGGGTGLSTCLCLHAEENALLEAGRERIRENTILYCDTYEFHIPITSQFPVLEMLMVESAVPV